MQNPFPRSTESLLAQEISRQPELWPTTLARIVPAAQLQAEASGPVVLSGAGTSAYSGSAVAEGWSGAKAIPSTDLLLQSQAEIESELPSWSRGGWMISLARSGDSPESTGVVEKIQKFFPRVRHLAIVCNSEGRVAKIPGVEVLLLDPRTNDRSLAMTASFSNLTLAGLALKHRKTLHQHLPAICERVTRKLLEHPEVFAQIARECEDRIVVLSSGMQGLTKEASLKILELTAGRVMAMPETFLGIRHGAVGFLRKDTPVLCFMSSDPKKRRYELDLIEDLRGKGLGKIVAVSGTSDDVGTADFFIPAAAPELPDGLRTPFEICVGQLLAYHLSLRAGVDPDNPSPEGTITRVVRPFRLHPA